MSWQSLFRAPGVLPRGSLSLLFSEVPSPRGVLSVWPQDAGQARHLGNDQQVSVAYPNVLTFSMVGSECCCFSKLRGKLHQVPLDPGPSPARLSEFRLLRGGERLSELSPQKSKQRGKVKGMHDCLGQGQPQQYPSSVA